MSVAPANSSGGGGSGTGVARPAAPSVPLPCDVVPLVPTSVSSLLTALRNTQTYDYMRAVANPDLTKYLLNCARNDAPPSLTPPTPEVIQFADEVIKINRRQKRQERVLIVTDRAIYNFNLNSFKTAKRRILIRSLRGLILSRCSDELVLQVDGEYDYRYEVRRRSELLEMLSRAYERLAEADADADMGPGAAPPPQLMVTFSEEAELKNMVITKDVLRNLHAVAVRVPHRLDTEDSEMSESRSTAGRLAALDGEEVSDAWMMQGHTPSTPSRSQSNAARPYTPTTGGRGYSTPLQYPSTPTGSHTPHPLTPKGGLAPRSSHPSATPTPVGRLVRPIGLVSHGAAQLGPMLLAKIAASRTGNFPSLAVRSHANSHYSTGSHLTSASTPATPGSNISSNGYYGSSLSRPMQIGVMSGQFPHGRQHSASCVQSSAQPTGMHAFRDPSSQLEGWLTKKKGSGKKWDRKYFILTNTHLQYFAPRIKGNVKLQHPVRVSRFNSDISLAEPSVSSSSVFASSLHAAPHSRSQSKSVSAAYAPSTPSASASTLPRHGGPGSSDALQLQRPSLVGIQGDTPLIMLRIESSTHLVAKDALTLAFASEDDASMWTAAFLSRNVDLRPEELGAHPHIEGWLLQKERVGGTGSSARGRWVRRYVVLTQDRCWFMEMQLKGSIDFSKGVSAHCTHEIQPTEEPQHTNFAGRYAVSRFAYRWNVSDAVRIFHLAADSDADMTQWIDSIDRVNREHGKAGGAGGASSDEEAAAAAAALAAASSAGSGAIKLPQEFISAVEQPAPEGSVTLVFTDVQSSTSLWEKVPDAMDAALEQHDRLLRKLLKKYNGYEVKTEGDAFMVTFFTPADAVLWCLAVQIALLEAEWSPELCAMKPACKETVVDPSAASAAAAEGQGEEGQPPGTTTVFNGIRIRMGIHTGSPAARRNPVTGRFDYFGQSVNLSARVSDAGHGGQVVATQEVIDALGLREGAGSDSRAADPTVLPSDPRLHDSALRPIVTDMGCHSLKGIKEPVRIFQIMPTKLKLRTLPPLRTPNNEKRAETDAAAAATAAPPAAASAPTASS